MKNIIIGHGESLTTKVKIKTGGGVKSHPYTREEGRKRFVRQLRELMPVIEEKPEAVCAGGEVVVRFVQHPTYLAKSYYPRDFFHKFNIRDIGSRPALVKPESWGKKKHPEKGIASDIFVSGTKDSFRSMLEQLEEHAVNSGILDFVRTFETISDYPPEEKIKRLEPSEGSAKFEVVLHASMNDKEVLKQFASFASSLGGAADVKRAKTVGGLTFVPVTAATATAQALAGFSHLRVIRSMPELRIYDPTVVRQAMTEKFSLPTQKAVSDEIKVCIFDGGIADNHLLSQWAREVVPENTGPGHPKLASHGGEVCAAYLFGPYDATTATFGNPYTNVDVVRVIGTNDQDLDLFDVLTRIEQTLSSGNYKYVNLSLGPRLPIDDDEVHVWTSVLDKQLQTGNCLATVAIGNDGDLQDGLGRIQPPSDMVNSLAVGASDRAGAKWARAPYSCVGPGRSPGLVKPDGLAFGGSTDEHFNVYSPSTDAIVGTMGTSYAAPYALRVAAGVDAITDYQFNPTTIKALMIHNATPHSSLTRHETGWGRLSDDPEKIIRCADDEAVIIFQGTLSVNEHVRIPIPVPPSTDSTWLELKATFCINSIIDPEHPLHYTRGGLLITFRPDAGKITDESELAASKTFFSTSLLYKDEQQLRDDAHKWETSISRLRRFRRATLQSPMFDVRYQAREQGASVTSDLEPLNYSLILTIRAPGDTKLYNNVLQENATLAAINLRTRIQVTG